MAIPPSAQLRDGLGEIRIDYAVPVPRMPGDRRFVLMNAHRSGESVCLASVVAPKDPAIAVLAQKRDARQSTYEILYRQRTSAAGSPPRGRVARLRS